GSRWRGAYFGAGLSRRRSSDGPGRRADYAWREPGANSDPVLHQDKADRQSACGPRGWYEYSEVGDEAEPGGHWELIMEITKQQAGEFTEMIVKGRLDGYWADHLTKALDEVV